MWKFTVISKHLFYRQFKKLHHFIQVALIVVASKVVKLTDCVHSYLMIFSDFHNFPKDVVAFLIVLLIMTSRFPVFES